LKEYSELLKKVSEASSHGYITTHRSGPTGIGKTLEDLLGIPENNIPSPDGSMIELKSARKNSKSMLTLFTKAPLPSRANSVLLEQFGYPSRKRDNTKELHTTVNAVDYNTIKGKRGFKIGIGKDRIELVSSRPSPNLLTADNGSKPEVMGFWDRTTLSDSFQTKLPRLLYVKADSRGKGAEEEFWFNEAWLLSGFDFDNFVRLLKSADILIDIRIGQYPDGRPHDHGTGFRVMPAKLDLCFSTRDRVL